MSNDPPKLGRNTVYRTIRKADLASAKLYLQQFSPELPETIPETTAIGTSAAVLRALKTKGEAEIGIFIAFSQIKPPIDRNVHPNVYDNQMIAKIVRATPGLVMMPVTVNDVRVELPAIHARGDFFGDKSEFFFLDDEANPLTLKFRVGIDVFKIDRANPLFAGMEQTRPPDREALQVVKISHRCATELVWGGGGRAADRRRRGGAGGASALEASLAKTRRAEVYNIFFSFNSDQIREESEPTLKELAGLLAKHADWKLSIEGHTDNVASDSANLELSRRRAAAVKDALVKRYKIDATRLTTAGYGESRPKDTNDTLEGRARNRRVELVRVE